MIRINLLPVRAAKKKETEVQQILIFSAVVVIAATLVMTLYFVKRAQVANTKSEITAANSKINELKARIGKLEELKTLKEQVKKKLDVLAQLRKNKSGPAQRLATLSDMTPEQLWLTGYMETGDNIRIAGIGYTEELIAQFMRALEASADFMNVELVVSEQTELAGTKLKRFEVNMKLKVVTPPAARK
jgi:type IV pilus assembly protein PilN